MPLLHIHRVNTLLQNLCRLKIAKQSVESELDEIATELKEVKSELTENQTDELIKEIEK